jgi:multidrug efflux system membrane fusion protein
MSQEHDERSGRTIRRSYVVAAVIFLLLVVWVGSGAINRFAGGEEKKTAKVGTQTESKGAPPTTTAATGKDGKPAAAGELTTVRVRTITAEQRQQDIVVRGQTEALRKVQVRAETAGKVAAIRADKGTVVKAGDTICELNVDARLAMLNEARATMKQRQLEYEASKTLQEKGFRSDTSVAGDLAEYQGAKAMVERMEKELANTKLKAPFDGIVDDRMVNVGDYLAPGQPCALVIDQDPFLVVGQVSEKDVPQISIGNDGWAKLISGERVNGKIRFIAKSSDRATRTFRVELEVPNPTGSIRDGITAEIHVLAKTLEAHRISPAILTLDERGTMGVKVIDQAKRVRFIPVTIVADGADGMWVAGLPKSVTIITVGQEYVTVGQEVIVAPEDKSTQS